MSGNFKIDILYQKWINLKPIKFILITTILMILLSVPVGIIFELLAVSENEIGGFNIEKHGLVKLFIAGVIISPMLETLLSQQLPILFSQKFIKNKPNIIGIILSTLIFSLLHFGYSPWYAIAVIPSGLILAKTFIIFQKRDESSFWMTSFLHSFRNLLSVIMLMSERYLI